MKVPSNERIAAYFTSENGERVGKAIATCYITENVSREDAFAAVRESVIEAREKVQTTLTQIVEQIVKNDGSILSTTPLGDKQDEDFELELATIENEEREDDKIDEAIDDSNVGTFDDSDDARIAELAVTIAMPVAEGDDDALRMRAAARKELKTITSRAAKTPRAVKQYAGGVINQRMNRETKTLITRLHVAQAGLDIAQGKYALRCAAHNEVTYSDDRRALRDEMGQPSKWCAGCAAIVTE